MSRSVQYRPGMNALPPKMTKLYQKRTDRYPSPIPDNRIDRRLHHHRPPSRRVTLCTTEACDSYRNALKRSTGKFGINRSGNRRKEPTSMGIETTILLSKTGSRCRPAAAADLKCHPSRRASVCSARGPCGYFAGPHPTVR
jgi:hypothetical protein